ncbi:MAG: hypothetical protein RL291_4, partial [Pseudomonadota bacterium]
MSGGATLFLVATGYILFLFAIAWFGDRIAAKRAADPAQASGTFGSAGGRPLIYALSIAVYCTSWTFFGSVGSASRNGYDFLGIYVGPILFFLFGMRFIEWVITLAKRHNSTSVADFMSARYGGSLAVAIAVTFVSLIGVLPYIALQLRAITTSVEVLVLSDGGSTASWPVDTSLIIAAFMAAFAVLFGTRRADATEHQGGMMLAIAAESLVKLIAFLAVGTFILLATFGSVQGFFSKLSTDARLAPIFLEGPSPVTFITYTFLSLLMVLLLPRQFHVTVVENKTREETRRARWLYPSYLIAINIFVIPIAVAGLIKLPPAVPPDSYVLALPLALGNDWMTALAFIGGLSAGTAMIIVDTVALGIMITNSFIVPFLVRKQSGKAADDPRVQNFDRAYEADRVLDNEPLAAQKVLLARRLTIFAVVLLGYAFFRFFGGVGNLVSIGLISFAAIAQVAPAFFGGLLWTRATAKGAVAAIAIGTAVWCYTLLLPWIIRAGWGPVDFLTSGPFGITMLAPQAIAGLAIDPVAHGVLLSLTANIATFVVVSLLSPVSREAHQQAARFLGVSNQVTRRPAEPQLPMIALGELHAQLAPYIGEERAHRIFREHLSKLPNAGADLIYADAELIRRTRELLTRVIGAASAEVVLQIAIDNSRPTTGRSRRRQPTKDTSRTVATEAAALASTWQSAVDSVNDGIAVFSKEALLLQANRRLPGLLGLPPEIDEVGRSLRDILALIAEREGVPLNQRDSYIEDRLNRIAVEKSEFLMNIGPERTLIVRSRAILPERQGAFVVTFSDLTARLRAEEQLRTMNATLEARVAERTQQADEARQRADRASVEKTKFLAAAGHDVMQPLNAARLYAAALKELPNASGEHTRLVGRIDSALNSVEEILGALTDIARLDQGKYNVQKTRFALQDILQQLEIEFEPQARAANLTLTIVPTQRAWVETDPALLRRMLQNFVSNAIKFTKSGGIVLGVRPAGANWRICVTDTGPGIPASKQAMIFEEFSRLDETAHTPGLGLGLSIVQRISGVLGVKVDVQSVRGRGSTFAILIPKAQRDQATVSSVRGGVQKVTDLSGLHVLVIDNEPRVLDGMQTLLTGWGCKVIAAHSVASAIELTRSGKPEPELICADYRLDDGTGLDAIVHVRA